MLNQRTITTLFSTDHKKRNIGLSIGDKRKRGIPRKLELFIERLFLTPEFSDMNYKRRHVI